MPTSSHASASGAARPPARPDDLFSWAAAATACTAPAPAEQSPRTPPAEQPSDYAAIIDVLSTHRGAAAAITAPDIAACATLWPHLSPANRGTRVRKLLEQHQDAWPFPICGDVDGYYVAETPDELTHYSATLRSRAMAILRRFASLRRAGRRAGHTYHGRGRWS